MEQCPNCRRDLTEESKRLGYCEFCGIPLADRPTPPFPLSLQRAQVNEEPEKAPDATPTLLPNARKKKRLVDFGSQFMRLSPGKHVSHKLQSGADATAQVAEETDMSANATSEDEGTASADDALAMPKAQAPVTDSVTLAATQYETFDDEEDEAAAPEMVSATPPREPAPPPSAPAPPAFVAPESAARVEPASSGPFTAQTTSPYPLPPAPPPWQMPPAPYAAPRFPATNAPMTGNSQPVTPVPPVSGQSRSDEYIPLPTTPSDPLYSGPGIIQGYPQSDPYLRVAPAYAPPNVTVYLPPGALPQSAPMPAPAPAKRRRTGRGFFAGCLTAILVIVAASAGVVTWGIKNGYSIPQLVGPATATLVAGTSVPKVPSGFATFVAPDNDYSLIYPVNWQQSSANVTGDAATTQSFTSPDEAYDVSLVEQSSLLSSSQYSAYFTTFLQPFAIANLQLATTPQSVTVGANEWSLLSATGTHNGIAYNLNMYGIDHDNHAIIFITMTPTAADAIANGQFFQPMLRSLQLIG